MTSPVRKKMLLLLAASAAILLLAAASATSRPEFVLVALLAASAPIAGRLLRPGITGTVPHRYPMEKVQTVGLGQGHYLHLVKVGTESVVLASGPRQTTLVMKLAGDVDGTTDEEQP